MTLGHLPPSTRPGSLMPINLTSPWRRPGEQDALLTSSDVLLYHPGPGPAPSR
jgi:hypothetical protein